MAFFECEFSRKIGFQRLGGPTASTYVVGAEGGAEQRNGNWAQFRRKYTASLITNAARNADRQAFVDELLRFFMLVGGKRDGFRFFDPLDCQADLDPVLALGGGSYQLQKTYSLGGRTLVRAITKPITSSVIDIQGNSLTTSVQLFTSGGSPLTGTIDHATGLVTGASGTVGKASFQYHIPVRFDTDDCDLQVEPSATADGNPIVSWNSLALVEVKPPNY